jgi:hypothetical protein
MPSSHPELADVQRWFQAAILGEAAPDDTADVVHPPARLDVYRHGYRVRLLTSLRETHPALRHALGERVFDAFAWDYLQSHPSRSYTLFRLSEGFADHLAATRPDGGVWPDFIIDLARLERIFMEVYEGPGIEGEPIPQLPAEPDFAAVLEPVCCLRLMRSRYPVGDFLLAVRGGDEPPLPLPAVSHLAVSRRDYVVTFTTLDAPRYAALESLAGGAPVGEAAAVAGLEPAELWTSVRAWARQGLIRGVIAV